MGEAPLYIMSVPHARLKLFASILCAASLLVSQARETFRNSFPWIPRGFVTISGKNRRIRTEFKSNPCGRSKGYTVCQDAYPSIRGSYQL